MPVVCRKFFILYWWTLLQRNSRRKPRSSVSGYKKANDKLFRDKSISWLKSQVQVVYSLATYKYSEEEFHKTEWQHTSLLFTQHIACPSDIDRSVLFCLCILLWYCAAHDSTAHCPSVPAIISSMTTRWTVGGSHLLSAFWPHGVNIGIIAAIQRCRLFSISLFFIFSKICEYGRIKIGQLIIK